jgi:hypothetical protein
MHLTQFADWFKEVCSQSGMGKNVNILPTVNEMASMNDMLNSIFFNIRDKKLIYAPLEIIKENWGVISNSPVSIGNNKNFCHALFFLVLDM